MTGTHAVDDAIGEAVVDAEHGWSIRIPTRTVDGAAVTLERGADAARHRVHAQTADGSTVYVEVVSWPEHVVHRDAIADQRGDLRHRAPDATIGEPEATEIAGRPATAFTFDGRLGEMRRCRRFVFVDTAARTLRIVSDPGSSTNEAILATLVLDEAIA